MRFAVPSTKLSKQRLVLMRFLNPFKTVSLVEADDISAKSSDIVKTRGGAVRGGVSLAASKKSIFIACPYNCCKSADKRPAYWARIQSNLNRLATSMWIHEKSSDMLALSGFIHVLNCCSGNSWANWSTQACHSVWPASDKLSGDGFVGGGAFTR